MNLNAYLERPNAMTLTALAALMGVSKGRLSQLRKSSDWPPDVALRAEAATEGVLDAGALSSMVFRARESQAAA